MSNKPVNFRCQKQWLRAWFIAKKYVSNEVSVVAAKVGKIRLSQG